MRRVVITGVGAVTPVGCGKEKFWNAIKSGVCGINTVSKFDTENFSCKVAGELTDFEITDYIEKKEARKMDEFTQYAVAAAKMAISDSGIDFEKTDMDRVGVILGCGIGGINCAPPEAILHRFFLFSHGRRRRGRDGQSAKIPPPAYALLPT